MSTLIQADQSLSTAHIVDACMRLKAPYRIAPYLITPVVPMYRMISGPAIPVRHYGSVDIFLELLETNKQKEGIIVIDNNGRVDEACIGDLIVLEVKQAGMQAIVVNGLHRDTTELLQIDLPVFSYGSYPSGPARLDSREADAMKSAKMGDFLVTSNDTVFADQDGIVFIETIHIEQIIQAARKIKETEMQQAVAAIQGLSLRDQFQFKAYLKERQNNESYTFRQHLSSIAKAIEE